MKSRQITHLCFLIPFILTVLNIQVLVTIFISNVLAQIIAYGNLGIIILGISLVYKSRGKLSRTSSLWIIFFIMYFAFAIFAGIIHDNPSNLLFSMVPFFYAIGFHFYLSIPENRNVFKKTTFIVSILSCIICIYWNYLNFDLDYGGIHIYNVDRAQGVYGDANNMALMSIISFIFVFKTYNPTKTIFKVFKLLLLAITAYSLFITFSNTGFMVFIVTVAMLNYKHFTGIKLVLGLILLPIIYLLLLNLNAITANINLVGQQRDKINNIVNMLSFNFDKVDDSGRNELLNRTLYYVYENPILGNGIDFAFNNRAHNTIIGVWADAGIFTLLFFLLMLGRYFAKSIKSNPEVRYFALPLLIAMCIFMLSLQSIINQPYLIALFIYVAYLVDNKSFEKEKTITQ